LAAAALLAAAPAVAGKASQAAGAAPAVRCGAPRPAQGQVFQGVILHVFDGATFCLAQGPTPDRWIRVRLSGGGAPGREALMAAAFARPVSCVASGGAGESVQAACSISGVNLAARSRDPAVLSQAVNWR
jgi:hypothetical protein